MTRPTAGARPRRRHGRPGRRLAAVGAGLAGAVLVDHGARAQLPARRQGGVGPGRARPHRGARPARLARPLRQRLPAHPRVLRRARPGADRPALPDPQLATGLPAGRPARAVRPGPDGWAPWVATFTENRQLPGEPDADGRATSVAEMLLRSALLHPRLLRLARLRPSARSPAVTLSTSPVRRRRPPGRVALGAVASTLLAVSQQLLRAGQAAARSRLAGPGGAAAIDARLRPAAGPARGRRCGTDVGRAPAARPGRPGPRRAERDGRGRARAATATPTTRSTTSTSGTGCGGTAPSSRRSQSAIVRGQYDLVFSHEDGDPARPAVRRRLGGEPVGQAVVRLQGRDLLEDGGRHGRRRVRAALPGAASPAGCDFRFCTDGRGAGARGGRLGHHPPVVVVPASLAAPEPDGTTRWWR